MYSPPQPGSGLPERASATASVATGVATKPPLLHLLTVEREDNPLRRYGYVSPHIGKLAPLDAGALDEIARLAAASLPAPTSSFGATLVVGMAESALLLAWFLAGRLGGEEELNLRFTTRERRPAHGGNGAGHAFLEPHSHGPVHSLALPPGRSYSRVVVVEDELTTGATLRNLLLAIPNVSPCCQVVTLSDGRPEGSRERLREEMRSLGVELSVADLSLLAGDSPQPPARNGLAPSASPTPHNPFSRPMGVLGEAVKESRRRWLASRPDCLYVLGESVDVAMALWGSLPPDERPAFRHVTRSPWLVDGGAITSRLDLCAPFVPRHFLYNWAGEAPPRRGLLVGERSTAPVAWRLRRFLRSRGIEAESVEVPPK